MNTITIQGGGTLHNLQMNASIASVDAPEAEPTEPKPKTSRINNLANTKKRKNKYNQNQNKKPSKTLKLPYGTVRGGPGCVKTGLRRASSYFVLDFCT